VKKTYVKPELDVIEFDLGEAIAASQCVAQMYNHAKENCDLLPPFDDLFSNIPPATLFDDVKKCGYPVEGYCYFTTNDTMVFAS